MAVPFTPQDPNKDFQNATGKKLKEAAVEVGKILGVLIDGDLITDRDRTFVADMRQKWAQYGEGLVVSPRQLFWLRDLKDKQEQAERIHNDDGEED